MTTKTQPADPVDMSAQAVARRLDEVRALCRLARYLGRFRREPARGPETVPAEPKG